MKHIDYFSPSDDPVGDASRYEYYRDMDAQNENEETEDKLEPWELKEKLQAIFGRY